jgi:hypothetical protein
MRKWWGGGRDFFISEKWEEYSALQSAEQSFGGVGLGRLVSGAKRFGPRMPLHCVRAMLV